MKTKLLLLLCCLMAWTAKAQNSCIHDNNIKTLQVIANDDACLPPVIQLGGRHHIDISFDAMTHEYHRYLYKIEHCNADWTPSTEIFESDFLEGFNDQPIEDYENSFNTTLLYTHYHLRIPNENISLKLTGNYRVTVYGDEEGDSRQPVVTACFSVFAPQVGISATITTNTDIDFNKTHQQLKFAVNHGSLSTSDPIRELKTVVIQNRRTDNRIVNPKPNIQKKDLLEYSFNKDLIFDAGNEFHKFEILGFNRANMNVDRIQWFEPYYHVTLYEDTPSKNYIQETDQNGCFVIRNETDTDNPTTSEYVWTHFTFKSPEIPGGNVYICGNWTYNQYTPAYQMKYIPERGVYECAQLLKQGYYDYQYRFVPQGQTKGTTQPTDGNFFQTENEYMILVYFRSSSSRYDQLVGYRRMNFIVP